MDTLKKQRKAEGRIRKSLVLLKYHEKNYLGGVNRGILLDDIMSLIHGLEFLLEILKHTLNEDLIKRIYNLCVYVKQKLRSLPYHRNDESMARKLADAYADLREDLANVIIKPGTNECDVIFPEIVNSVYSCYNSCSFLCKKIKKLLDSDCKADQITQITEELEGIYWMLYFLQPMFEHANCLTVKEEEEEMYSNITAVTDRATYLIYLSFVRKMDGEMVLSLKDSFSGLIIKEVQIMGMYLVLDSCDIANLGPQINMLLRLLEWNKKCYLGMEMGARLEDHFMSIEHGLQLLLASSKFIHYDSRNVSVDDLQFLVAIMKLKLYSLPNNQMDTNLIVNLEQAYGKLRDWLCNFAFSLGANLFSGNFEKEDYIFLINHINIFKNVLVKKIRKLVAPSCKGDKITPIMLELVVLRNKLISLEPLFQYLFDISTRPPNVKQENVLFSLATFLVRATGFIYLSFVGNEDVLVPLRNYFSLLIEETEIKEMSLILGIVFPDDLEADFVGYLSFLKRWEAYHMGTMNEEILKDSMSLKHGIELLKWLPRFYIGINLDQRILVLAGNVRRKLESLTWKYGDESLNMDVNGAYTDLKEEMMNLIINQATNKYDIKIPDLSSLNYHFRGDNSFLVEKIKALENLNCKADQIAPLMKELQDLRKMLTSLTPLARYVNYVNHKNGYPGCKIESLALFLTFHHKAAFLIYLSFVGKMDKEMMLSVKHDISTTIKEIDVLEMYTMILNEALRGCYNYQSDCRVYRDYIDKEFPGLENLILLLKSNVKSLDDANSKLYEELRIIHGFLLALSPNVILRKLHLLKESFGHILLHSIPIIYSCYLEPTEVDISVESKLKCVLDEIKHIKSETEEIKLYYFPRVDDLGFLEFFRGYIQDLKKNKEIPMKEKINTLHLEVHSLLSLAKGTNQGFPETAWTEMINLAYQTEYIVDLYLVSSSTDLRLTSSLSRITDQLSSSLSTIIEQLHNIRAGVRDAATWDFAHLCRSLPAQDVVTSKLLNDNDAIVSLQKEARIMTEYLLMGEKKLDVISIVGMAGVGKTTLASVIFKSTPSIADQFDILAWCTVSQSYENRDLILSILDQVDASDKRHRDISDDQELADHLCRSLKKRRYLIFLDDVWDTALWSYLKRYLRDDCNGSRILITTRNRDVADQIGSKVNELHELSEENSWELFQKKMVEKERLSDDLLNISKGIVNNCKGLPLSIVIIAGILSDIERTEKKWYQIAESVSSLVLSDPQGNCKAILELSYNHLAYHLRSCFLYLGSFEEDQEISVNRLINLWIAEGFIQDTKSVSADEVARKYVDDLIAKNLVIPAKERSRGGVKTLRLHDLLRDFCLDHAKEKHFLTVLSQRNKSRPLQDPRRLIINWPLQNSLRFSCHGVRSMICNCRGKASEIEMKIRSRDMVLLNVLAVDNFKARLFPLISSLVHLRYMALGLQDWKLPALPSSINNLQNLEILILRCTFSRSIRVPDFIWDMVKLRHVHIRSAASFEVDSNRLDNSSFLLENLRSLSMAYISFADSKWLSKLSGLQRLSCIFTEQDTKYDDDGTKEDDITGEVDAELDDDDGTKVVDTTDKADDAELDDDDGTKEDDTTEKDDDAELDDDDDDGTKEYDITDEDDDAELQKIIFNDNLTSLKVEHEGSWYRSFLSSFQLPISLQVLTLSYFSLRPNEILDIGRSVPHLEVFKICDCSVPSGCIWNVDNDDFPKLKVLKLTRLKICKWNTSEDSFPSLEQLWVERCDCLDEIPLEFGYLPNLRLIYVRDCAPSVDDSAREIENLQQEDQNTEMRVNIYPRKYSND